MNPRRLYRSVDDRILAGVAGGVAAYFDVDPVIVHQLLAQPPDADFHPLGQRVHAAYADAVESAGDLVAPAVAELAAGVQHGQYDFDRRPLLLGHDRDRDAPAIVNHGDGIVGMDRDQNL